MQILLRHLSRACMCQALRCTRNLLQQPWKLPKHPKDAWQRTCVSRSQVWQLIQPEFSWGPRYHQEQVCMWHRRNHCRYLSPFLSEFFSWRQSPVHPWEAGPIPLLIQWKQPCQCRRGEWHRGHRGLRHRHGEGRCHKQESGICFDLGASDMRAHVFAQESLSSAGTPHKRDSLTYSAWLEDSVSSTSNTSRGSSPGKRVPFPHIYLYINTHSHSTGHWMSQMNVCLRGICWKKLVASWFTDALLMQVMTRDD